MLPNTRPCPAQPPSAKNCLAQVSVVPRSRNPDTQGLANSWGWTWSQGESVWGKEHSTCVQYATVGSCFLECLERLSGSLRAQQPAVID